jgi:hypothetical protein
MGLYRARQHCSKRNGSVNQVIGLARTAAENIAVAMIATGSTPAEARRGTSESLETALPPDRIEVIGQPGC